MVFGDGFDKTLLLILISDKNNREQIINLIKSVPLELMERIQNVLSNKDNCLRLVELNQFIRDDNGNNLMFRISINESNLRIKLSKWKQYGNNYEEEYDLDLGKISLDMIPDDDIIYIGSFYNSISELFLGIGPMFINSDGVGYELYIGEDNKLVVQISGNRIYDKKINMDILSVDFRYNDLNDKNIKRLIKGKR